MSGTNAEQPGTWATIRVLNYAAASSPSERARDGATIRQLSLKFRIGFALFGRDVIAECSHSSCFGMSAKIEGCLSWIILWP